MNKTELVEKIAKNTGVKKKDVEAVIAALVTSVEQALVDGEKVQVSGLGSFDVKKRAERVGRNPIRHNSTWRHACAFRHYRRQAG